MPSGSADSTSPSISAARAVVSTGVVSSEAMGPSPFPSRDLQNGIHHITPQSGHELLVCAARNMPRHAAHRGGGAPVPPGNATGPPPAREVRDGGPEGRG